jgi:hypothetical protein
VMGSPLDGITSLHDVAAFAIIILVSPVLSRTCSGHPPPHRRGQDVEVTKAVALTRRQIVTFVFGCICLTNFGQGLAQAHREF